MSPQKTAPTMIWTWLGFQGMPVLIQKYFGVIVFGIGATRPPPDGVIGRLRGTGFQTGSCASPAVSGCIVPEPSVFEIQMFSLLVIPNSFP
jgi:hypothetical protein